MEMDRNGDGPAAEIVVCSEGCREELLRCLELGQGAADDEWSFQVTQFSPKYQPLVRSLCAV